MADGVDGSGQGVERAPARADGVGGAFAGGEGDDDRATAALAAEVLGRNHLLVEFVRGQLLAPGGDDEALRRLTEASSKALGGASVGVWVYEEGGAGLRCVDLFEPSSGAHRAGERLALAGAPAYAEALGRERVIAARRAELDPRTREAWAAGPGPARGGSLLAAPVRTVGGAAVGVVTAARAGAPHDWSLAERVFAGAAADLVALALGPGRPAGGELGEGGEGGEAGADGARLARERRLRRHNERLARLGRSEAVVAGDLEGAFREITRAAAESLGVRRSSVWLYADGRSRIRCSDLYDAGRGGHERGAELSAADFPVYFAALEQERTIAADDANRDPRTREFSRPYLTPLGIGAMLDAPIWHQGRVVGIVCNEHVGPPRAWTPEDESVAGSLADFAALALASAERRQAERAVAEQAQELARLYAVARCFVPFEFLAALRKSKLTEVAAGDYAQCHMTVLFADIRAFTARSEARSPEENFRFINAYHRHIEPCVYGHGGFINQYYGDGIMALFPRSADDALEAGRAMLDAVEAFNDELVDYGQPAIQIGVGLNSGVLALGTVGSVDRLDTGVIGDAVNLAARVEGMTKLYGASLLLSESTRDALAEPNRYPLRTVDRVVVKGRNAPVTIYELLGAGRTSAPDPAWRERHERAVRAYGAGDFAAALAAFEAGLAARPGDDLSALYVRRCRELLAGGAPPDWSPVTRLDAK
jgi:class 3 adenylate cyclase